MADHQPDNALPAIPVVRTGPDFPYETLEAEFDRAHALIGLATQRAPARVLKVLDQISRRWLVKSNNASLAEIDRIAARLGRPGAYFLSVNYEWGCTTAARPAEDGDGAVLVRVLDWLTPGLGRHVIAADVDGPAGRFTTMTWPGYTGVLTATAPGRFAAAINQAPMARAGGGLYPVDWFVNRVRVWRSTAETPGHLLRRAFESAPDFAAARRMLIDTPISTPVIFTLVGVRAEELCVIERTQHAASVHDGATVTANAWRTPGWQGRMRGKANPERMCNLARARVPFDAAARARPDVLFNWLSPPVLNPLTRLAFIANPAVGAHAAIGIEAEAPATGVLVHAADADADATPTTSANPAEEVADMDAQRAGANTAAA